MNKVALVTGGSRGIGSATAIHLAKAGMDVAVNYLENKAKANEVVEQIKSLGQNAIAVQADVGSYEQVQQMAKQIVDELSGLQVLVNNAGYSSHFGLTDLTPEEWRKMCAVTLDAAFYCAKEAVPHMKSAGWGRIVNISSLRAMTGSAHGPHYASSKAGLLGLTKSLALDLGPDNITVNAISPGYTETDMTRKSIETKGEQVRATIPVRKIGSPGDIASAIAFLCSDGGSYITGETINVNGGIYMRS